MSRQISAVLPDDVEEMMKREMNGRSISVTIVEALRAYWSRPVEPVPAAHGDIYPVYGSIPADRKDDAGA
jgi:hypothetical protein